MRAAVVGAGVAGLAAARALSRAGWQATVFERDSRPGGRCATLRSGGYVFDYGATSVAARGLALERAMLQELPSDGLVQVELPVYVHDGLRVAPGDPGRGLGGRYCYSAGMDELPRLLAEGLDVRLGQAVESIQTAHNRQYTVAGETFDGVVVAAAVPDAEALVGQTGARRLGGARYRPCISVMLGLRAVVDTPYFALIDQDANVPLTWLSVESAKVPAGRAPAGCCAMVAQLSPAYSVRRDSDPDATIVHETLVDVGRLLRMDLPDPEFAAVHRWRHSQPEATVSFGAANPPGSRVVLAGDGLAGGRLELAYESGLRAAAALVGAEWS